MIRRAAAVVAVDAAILCLLFLAGEGIVRCLREKAIARGGEGFFQDGVHFSAAGSDLAAAALLERLERDGLLP